MAEKIKLNFEIDGLKDANKQLEQLESTAEDLKKQLDGVEEGSDAFNAINKELAETNKQMGLLKDATGQIGLDKTFEEALGEAKPLNTQLGELEDRMYALAAAGLQNTEGFRALQDEVVGIRQTIIRVDESVDDLAANKGLSTFGSQIGGIGESLMTLDFERASKQAQGLANNVGNIKFGGVIKGVQNLGSVFINLGKALLANPIFLIAAAIALIVTAVVALMQKLGILKPILDAIGKVFGWIGDAIDAVVDSFKAFTDWLGFTNNAAEENAERVAAAAKKKAKAVSEANEEAIAGYDNEIRMLELNGIENEKQLKKKQDLEKKKAKAISETAKTQAAAAEAELKAARIKGDLDEEEMQALRDKVRETQLAYKQTVEDIKFANAAASKELDKFREDQKKKQEEEDKRKDDERKARAAKYKQFLADRLAAERQQQDLELELMAEGTEKELEANRIKFERMREDTMSATNLTQTEKLALVDYYNQLEIQKNKELNDKKAADDKAAADKKAADEAAALLKQQDLEDAQFALLQELTNTQQEQEIADLVAHYETKFALAEGNDELEKALKEKQGEELAAINKKWKDKEAADDEAAEKEKLDSLKSSVDETAAILSSMAESTSSIFGGILASLTGNINSVVDLLNQEFESTSEKVNAYVQTIGNVIGGVLSAISDANQVKLDEQLEAIDLANAEQQSLLDTQLNNGLIAQEEFDAKSAQLEFEAQKKAFEARKKAFEDDKKLKIAQAVISGIQGAVSAFTGAFQLGPIAGPIVGGILAAAVAAMTAINVSKIKSTKFSESAPVAPSTSAGGGGSGGLGGGAAPTPPSISLFGQAAPGSEGQGQQEAGLRQQSVVKAVVVESDITNTQNRLDTYQQRSEIG